MSAPTDQAAGLRRLLQGSSCRVIALAALSPGAGVTTAAMNLGVALAGAGRPVLLLDEQERSPQSACAGWAAAPRGTLEDVAGGRCDLATAAAAVGGGVSVLPAPASGGAGRFDPRALCPGGVVVIDSAFGRDGQLSPLARLADELVIVMQPVAASITATYAGLKRLQHTHALQQFHFLVNQAESAAQAELVMANVCNASGRYLAVTLRPLGWIGRDPLVGQARAARRTVCELAPGSATACEFRRMAQALRQPVAPAGAGEFGAVLAARPGRAALARAANVA